MRLNKFQYKLFKQIALVDKVYPKKLTELFSTNPVRISRSLRVLAEQNLISKSDKQVSISRIGLAALLARFLIEHPGIEEVLADSGFLILQLFNKPRSSEEIARKMDISKRSAYRYIQMFLNRGMIIRQNQQYILNERLWPDLKELIIITNVQSGPWKYGIPSTAKIYFQEPGRVIFSTEKPIAAIPTAFSRYSEFNIPILEGEKIYRLPMKKLTLQEVFLDSLECITDARRKILCVLFYLKYETRLQQITHPELEKIKKVIKGEPVSDYPTLEEIKERAALYDIPI